MKKIFGFALSAACVLTLVSGCDTKKKADNTLDSVKKTSDEYRRLAQNLNATINDLRAAAKAPVNVAPASVAKAPKLPAKVTGGVDINKSVPAKQGKTAANVDGVGSNEDVTALVPDDAASAPEFVSWAGDADSDDAGVCYLAWDKDGATWVVASACDESADGAFVCQVVGEEASCSACNVEGACNACDMTQENLECTWPGAAAPADGQ